MKLITILLLFFVVNIAAQEKFTEYDSLRVVELQKEIDELKQLNQQNEIEYNAAYRLYAENQKVINMQYAEKQNKLNALLEKKKGKENGKRK